MADQDAFFDRLRERYPKMYSDTYDVWVDEGWHSMLDVLSANIQARIDWMEKLGSPIAQVAVEQVKEKFGTLRFYYSGGDEMIDGMVEMAESMSAHICERCGKPGSVRDGGWIKTLCDEHEHARQQNRPEVYDSIMAGAEIHARGGGYSEGSLDDPRFKETKARWDDLKLKGIK